MDDSKRWFPSDTEIQPERMNPRAEEISSKSIKLPETPEKSKTPTIPVPVQPENTMKFQHTKSMCSSMKETSCLDCRTMEFCTGEWVNNQYQGNSLLINCANQTNNLRPYCDGQINKCVVEDTCTKRKHSITSSKTRSGLGTSSFELEICTAEGPQPDPFDCTRYIHCYKNQDGDYDGKYISCPSDAPVYDAASQRCGFFPCLDLRSLCTNNLGKMIAYKPLPKIYGKCPNEITNAANFDMNLYLCVQNHTFSEETVSCEPVCENEGFIPSNYDCRAYYMCEKKITSFTFGLQTCQSGYEFSPSKLQCVTASKSCNFYITTNYRKRLGFIAL